MPLNYTPTAMAMARQRLPAESATVRVRGEMSHPHRQNRCASFLDRDIFRDKRSHVTEPDASNVKKRKVAEAVLPKCEAATHRAATHTTIERLVLGEHYQKQFIGLL
jgi:hypothetical protein